MLASQKLMSKNKHGKDQTRILQVRRNTAFLVEEI